jgi:selenide,water dikinase
VLDKLPPVSDPRLLVSTDAADDAGVYLLSDGTALIFTVDFFTPVVDDPKDFGRIAAANALSDVYAMGGRPLLGVNIICFPEDELPLEVMTQILLGGDEKMREAGAIIVGGHSVSDRELKYGLAVIGIVRPDCVVTNAGARPGEALVLTKPIGTGVLATALKNERLSAERLSLATDVMSSLNQAGSEAMVEAGASAATDVTGFGLLGHAVEMADASGVTIEIEAGHVPLLDGALEAAESGFTPGGLLTNQEYFRRFVRVSADAESTTLDLLWDPQTSGGLLIAIPELRLAAFSDALARRGGRSWVVGRTVRRGERSVVVR